MMPGRSKARAVFCLLAGIALGVHAEDAEAPSLDLLEYLGTLVESDGEWLGPDDLKEDTLFRPVADTTDALPASKDDEEVIE
jgi:hypothetical protein